ncbi:MAG: DUF6175 family protein [Alistipes sp.]
MKIVKFVSFVLFALFAVHTDATADSTKKDNANTESANYDIEQISVSASTGVVNLRVHTYTSKPVANDSQIKKNAIHACLFKGIPAAASDSASQKEALINDPATEAKYDDYFKSFLADGGLYMRYADVLHAGAQSVVKLKKGYRISKDILVKYGDLRKRLEADGIIESLGGGQFEAKEVLPQSNVAVRKPTIMVMPSDTWCAKNGYMTDGKPDYKRAVLNGDLAFVISKLGEQMTERGFNLKLLDAAIRGAEEDETRHLVTKSQETNARLAESTEDRIKRYAKADFVMYVDWDVSDFGLNKVVAYNLQGVDSYTAKQAAASSGASMPSKNPVAAQLLIKAVNANMEQFAKQLHAAFTDMARHGREVVIECECWEDSPVNFESDINGKELGMLIEDYLADNAVTGVYSTRMATANKLSFEQVRIPLSVMDGTRERAIDTRYFGRGLAKYIEKATGTICKVETIGLGKAIIILGGK